MIKPSSMMLLLPMALLLAHSAAASQCSYHQQQDEYQCRLRTLQDGIEIETHDLGSVKKLRVKCSDLFFSESQVRPGHFSHLPQLEDLDIEFCKVRKVPERAFQGLHSLRRLSLQSHNTEWSSALMELHAESLQQLESVETLTLSANNLWSLPQGLFCNLPSLREVNLSRNHIVDVSDLNLALEESGSCSVQLTALDLSENFISSLHGSDLALVSSLQRLSLADNKLSILEDGALDSVSQLQELNLSNNQLAALPSALFKKTSLLQKLELQNNSLNLLPAGTFQGLDALVLLNLSRNAISGNLLTGEDTFQGLRGLQVLDLSHNRISQLEAAVLLPLTQLQILRLQHNDIHTLAPSGFSAQPALKMLSLSNNNLGQLPTEAFHGLSSLTSLSIDHNELTALPDNVFRGTPELEDFSADSNNLPSVPIAIRALKSLRTLNLGDNNLEELSSGDFSSLRELYGLRLAGNKLRILGPDHLSNNTKLHVLNLARNQLSKIEQKSLDNLQDLRALRLDNNQLSDINGIVSSLTKLQWFNVSSNQLAWFDYAFIPTSLEWLDLHDNNLEELGNYYKLEGADFKLKTLDASENKIRRLRKLSLPSNVERVVLSRNEISALEPNLFGDKASLKTVDLVANKIQRMDLSALYIGEASHKAARPEFLLSGNPFQCDCEMAWLQQINDIALNGNHPTVPDLENVQCRRGANATSSTPVPILSVPETDFLCEYTTHCFPMCMCCEFYACDCRMQCPEGCDCLHDATWSNNVIQCSNRGHVDVPLLIPMDATVIRLDGNNLSDVDTQSFIGRRRVQTLLLNGSHISTISKETFTGLTSLEVLHLEDNEIKELHWHEFQTLSNSLRELYLQNNELIHIASATFDSLSSLAVLRLDGNLLTTFPIWSLTGSNPFLTTLYLAENMWSCECGFLEPFGQFLLAQGARVQDTSNVECVTPALEGRPVVLEGGVRVTQCLANGRASNELLQGGSDDGTVSNDVLVPVIVSAVVLLLVTVAAFLVVCVFRARIKQWLYNKSSEIYESRSGSSVASGNSTYGQNKLFDVYISYSMKDSDFVDQSLSPALEQGTTSFKLCLHQRDFPPSASLYDTVSVATESSSRVVVVISKNYLDTEWNHVKIPLRNALHKDTSRLVLLILEDPTEEELRLHPELKQYMKSCASVKWGSPGFLNKLRFFLPEPAFMTFQRNVTLRTLQPASLLKSSSLMQVDAVSGVWTYTLNNSSPHGSVSTQSTNDQAMTGARTHLPPGVLQGRYSGVHNALPAMAVGTPLPNSQHAPSVISSLYSHHTYQSIPEHHMQQLQLPGSNGQQQHHIYHTLEPSLQQQHMQAQHLAERVDPEVEQINAVYINRNLDLVMKSSNPSSEASSPRTPKKSSFRSTSSSSGEDHCHSHTHSSISAQQLLPSSKAEASPLSRMELDAEQDNEYIV